MMYPMFEVELKDGTYIYMRAESGWAIINELKLMHKWSGWRQILDNGVKVTPSVRPLLERFDTD